MKKLLTTILLSGLPLAGSTIQTATCLTEGGPTITGTANCKGPSEQASSSIYLILSPNAANPNVLMGATEATASTTEFTADHPLGVPTQAQANATLTETLMTSGPVRQGYIIATIAGGGSHTGEGTASETVSLPLPLSEQSFTCDAKSNVGSDCNLATFYLRHFNPIPFTLGSSFVLSYSAFAEASAGLTDSHSTAASTLDFTFEVTELDGTPVAVTETPEPASWALLTLAVALCILQKFVLRRQEMTKKLFRTAVLMAPLCMTATTTQTATCSSSSSSTVMGSTSCVAVSSRAGSELSFVLAANPAGDNVLTAVSYAVANGYDPMHGLVDSYARADSSLTETLTTAGPGRAGYLLASIVGGSVGQSEDGGAYSWSNSQVAFPLPSLGINSLNCDNNRPDCNGLNGLLHYYAPIPFTLGQAFNMSFMGFAYASADRQYGTSSQSAMTFSFRLTELDGTPVAVTETPEPASWAMYVMSALIALMLSFKVKPV